MAFDERVQKAFDFAADLTKQLITIAAAILTFTVTFIKDGAEVDGWQKAILILSWITLILSIGCGIMTLMALTGNLDPKADTNGNKTPILEITSKNVTGSSKQQILLFLAGIIFTAISGGNMLFHHEKKTKNTIIILHKSLDKKTGVPIADTIYYIPSPEH